MQTHSLPPPAPSGEQCPDHAHVPPCSTEIPIPDDGRMLLQISAVLQQLCDHNSDLRAKCLTIFDSVAKPAMSVHHYLVRIHHYTEFDSVCFLVALAFLRRLCERNGPPFCPTHHNIHRLMIAALVVASKANDGDHLALRSRPCQQTYIVHTSRARFSSTNSKPWPTRSQTLSIRTSSWPSAAASPTPS